MADVNKVILIGRLTRDPQLKYLPSQTAVCEFGLAVGRKFKAASGEQREETNFIDCTVFGKGGEIFNQYMTKGKQVYVEGRLKYDSWEDKSGGGKRSKLTVAVEDFQFLGGRDAGDNDSQLPHNPARGRSSAGGTPGRSAAPKAPYGDEQAFNDDDIPFASAPDSGRVGGGLFGTTRPVWSD